MNGRKDSQGNHFFEGFTSQYPKLTMSFQLGTVKAISVLPTQWMQVAMRYQQTALVSNAVPRLLSTRQAFMELWNHQSTPQGRLATFFKGTQPAMMKEFFKNFAYKGVLIEGAPRLADSMIPTVVKEALSTQQNNTIKSLIAGTIAAAGDVFFGGTIEAYATYRAAAQGENSGASFKKDLQKHKSPLAKLSFLYRGAVPSTFKGTVAFSTFFYTSQPIKNAVNQFYDVPKNGKSPWYASLTAATLSGVAVAMTSSPFDIAKTQAQMPNSKNKSLSEALTYNFKNYGVRGLTAGLTLKSVMAVVGWGLAFAVTQRDKVEAPSASPSLRHH